MGSGDERDYYAIIKLKTWILKPKKYWTHGDSVLCIE